MRLWWLVVSAVGLAGCGAMLNGPVQLVKITTIPPGATVTVDGETMRSPARLDLERGREYPVEAERPGFELGAAEIRSYDDNYVILGNCLFFLCIPQIWESGTPLQQRLEPLEVEITLNPEGWSPR